MDGSPVRGTGRQTALVEKDDAVLDRRTHHTRVTAVDSADMTADGGEFVALLGPSGSGKTTPSSMIGGLLVPTAGTVRLGPTANVTSRRSCPAANVGASRSAAR